MERSQKESYSQSTANLVGRLSPKCRMSVGGDFMNGKILNLLGKNCYLMCGKQLINTMVKTLSLCINRGNEKIKTETSCYPYFTLN
jgi:hypothetical protein